MADLLAWLRFHVPGFSLEEVARFHPPMPVQVLRALVATALVWRWPHLAVIMVLGFFGLLRPCELIGLRRQDVVLPSDSFEPKVLYLRVGQPKTRHRGAANQHVRVDEDLVADWINLMLTSMPPWRRIWNGSWSSFKTRFHLLQQEVLGSTPFLPSSLRPGGATYLFRLWDENLPRLQWRGRWRLFRMLETHVQELGAAEVFVKFSPKIRRRGLSLNNSLLQALHVCQR